MTRPAPAVPPLRITIRLAPALAEAFKGVAAGIGATMTMLICMELAPVAQSLPPGDDLPPPIPDPAYVRHDWTGPATARLHMLIPPGFVTALDRLATATGCNRSEALRRIILRIVGDWSSAEAMLDDAIKKP